MRIAMLIDVQNTEHGGEKPDDDEVLEAIREEIEALEVWVDEYAYTIRVVSVE